MRTGTGWRLLLLGALAVLAVWAIRAEARDSDKPAAQPENGGKRAAAPASQTEKTFGFDKREEGWNQVMVWLADISGMPLITQLKPTGTFTFIPPRSGANKYTLGQIVDILNDALTAQKMVLIRRPQSWTIVAADQEIDPVILPRILLEDLDKRGDSEMVQIVLPLHSLVADDAAAEVKQMKGPFGKVVALTSANQLLLTDNAGNLRRIRKTLMDMEDAGKQEGQHFTYKCNYIKAIDAMKVLKELMPDPREAAPNPAPGGMFRGFPGGGGGGFLGGGGGGFGGGGGGFGGGRGGFLGGGGGGGPGGMFNNPAAAQQNATTTKIRMHYITADERTNSVLIIGPADKIATAKKILEKIDIAQPGKPPVLIGPPEFRTYPVPSGNADTVARTLSDIYKASNSTRISAVGTHSILVYAGPEEQFEIAKHVEGTKDKSVAPELIALNYLEASKVVETLKGMYGSDSKSGAPFLEADSLRNAVIVKGTSDQVSDIKLALKALGEVGGDKTARIISLDQGNAGALAEELQRILSEDRGYKVKVRVIGPNGASEEKKEEKKTQPQEKKKEPAQERGATRPSGGGNVNPCGGSSNEEDAVYVQTAAQIVDPQQKQSTGTKAADEKPTINITVVGNRLMITSDDPNALQMAQDVVRLLTRNPGGEGSFEVIKLQNANAVDAAKILDEIYNGKPEPTNNNPFGFGGRFGPFGNQQPATPKQNRIRVVADAATNSLFVKASPIDMIEIRSLLKKGLDSGDSSSKAVIKPWILPAFRYANANEVANVIKDVYREHINNNPISGGPGGMRGFMFGGFGRGAQNVDANGNPIGISLSIGVDDRTNSLVLACSEPLYKDIKKLAEALEEGAKSATQTVRVVNVKGIDPVLLEQAIDVINGRSSGIRRNTQGGFNGFGPGGLMPGQSPFNRGGFGGGGGGGFGGGGRGGGTPPRTSYSGSGPQSRGPDFFADRVKDDPQTSTLFDPQHVIDADQQPNTTNLVSQERGAQDGPAPADSIQQVSHEEQQPPSVPPPATPSQGDIRAPRGQVTAEALEQLGIIVVRGNTVQDVEEVLKIIEVIQRYAQQAEVEFQLHPLKEADATSVANSLTQLYRAVRVNPSGNVAVTTPTTGGVAQPGQFGQATALQQQQQQNASVFMLPLPRFNAILIAAPHIRMKDVVADVERLDKKNSPIGGMTSFRLKKASASRVATLLTNLYAQRYTGDINQVRITYEDSTNTVFVQAAPADLEEIRGLIEQIDNSVSSAVSDLRIIPLHTALSDEVTTLLVASISQGIVAPSTTTTPTLPTGGGVGGLLGGGALGGAAGLAGGGALGGAAGLAGGGALGGAGGLGGLGGRGLTGGLPGTVAPAAPSPTAAPVSTPAQTTGTTKTISLRFFSNQRGAMEPITAGVLEDVHITSIARLNSLLIAAPPKTMELIVALIHDLDIPPAARAEIKVFTLTKADASIMANTLAQLFFGTSAITTTGAGGLPGGGLGGAGTTLPTPPTFPGVVGPPRTQYTITQGPAEGAPLVQLQLTVDTRSNSLIVAGGRNELDVVEALIYKLQDTSMVDRHNEVFHLRNASAADVASELTTFLTNSLSLLARGGAYSAFIELQRDVVVVPDPFTNKLLISVSPAYYPEVVRLINELDANPPMVVIQVLVADIELNNTEEFGVEIGLQSPVLFARNVIPQQNFIGSGTVSYANATGSTLIPPGVTVSNTINPTAFQGFNFNNASSFSVPLGNNPVTNPGVVGFQGLNNFGVGRADANGLGGFIFSAASDTFNLLIRALKTQGRLDLLSRPQLTTLDGQVAYLNVGQSVPYVTGTVVTSTGLVTNTVSYRDVGVLLQVTPRISPDGTVLMRVIPEVSSVAPTQINLGNGQLATQFNVQHVETTVSVQDGQTVAIGGLIVKKDQKTENKVPWLGDLPLIGELWRYRTQNKSKTELLVILTPHIVRSRMEADRILAEEAHRMDWCVGDIVKIQGPSGLEPILPPPAPQAGGPGMAPPPGTVIPGVRPPTELLPGVVPEEVRETMPPPRVVPDSRQPAGQPAPAPNGREPLPAPRPLPPGQASQGQVPATTTALQAPLPQAEVSQPWPMQPAAPSPDAEPPKEKKGWSLFRRWW
jgi:type II secretion system protein D